MAARRRSERQMLELHARALMALHRIYESNDPVIYTRTIRTLEALAADLRREEATTNTKPGLCLIMGGRQREGRGRRGCDDK